MDAWRGFSVRCIAFLLVPIAIATVGAASARAATTYTWTGAVNGNWSNAGNWSGGAVPTAGGNLVFPSGAATLATTNDLIAGTSFLSLKITGSGYTLAGNAISLAGNLTDSDTSGANAISLDIAIPASRTFAVTYAAETLTLSGTISGAGKLTKSGAGVLVLGGTNTFSGGFAQSAGTVSVSSDASFGTVPASPTAANLSLKSTLATTATFAINANRGIAYVGTMTIDVAPGTTLTYGGIATGTYAVTKANGGTLVLSGTNTNTGAIALTGGILSISADANLGAAPATAATMITFNGGNLDTTATFALAANRNMKFTQNATIDVAPGTTLTYGGIASGSGSSLTLPDTGTLLLTGTNTYTGDTAIAAGTLQLGSATALSGSSDVVVTGTLDLDGNSNTIGSLAGTGTVTNSAATAATLGTNKDSASTTFSGVIADGAGSVSLAKLGSGTLVLSGSNTYSGSTTVTTGTLAYGAVSALPSTTDVTVTGTAKLDLAGYSVTIGSLAGTGGVEDSGAAATLTTNGDNASTTFSGVAADLSGPLSLVKAGSGTLTLSGTNTYTGTTTVRSGTLQFGKANALSSSDVIANAALDVAGYAETLASLSGTGTVENSGTAVTLTVGADNGSTVFSGLIEDLSGVLSLKKTGTGTMTLSGNNTYSGSTTLAGGTLGISADANLGTAPATPQTMLTFSGGTLATTATVTLDANRNMSFTQNAVIDVAPATTLTYGGVASGSGKSLTLPDTGTLLLTGTNTYTGATAVAAGTLQFGSTSALSNGSDVVLTGTLDLYGNSNTIGSLAGTGTVTNSVAVAATLSTNKDGASTTFSGTIEDGAGGVSLEKVGTGTLVLTGTNTFSGTTTATSGVLQIGAAGTLPSTAAIVGNGGTFDINGFDTTIGSLSGTGKVDDSGTAATIAVTSDNSSSTYSGVIEDTAGPLSLIKSGSGTFTLAGVSTYAGTTTVATGTLQLGKANALSSSTDVIVTGTLDLGGFSDAIGSLAGSGTVENSGSAATLTANADNASTTFSGILEDLSGALSLTKSGTGSLTLTANNTYSGTTKIIGGTLYVDGTQPASSVTLAGGTLAGNGTAGPVDSSSSSGTLSPGNPVAVLTTGNINLTAGAPTFDIRINGATVGSSYSQLSTSGSIKVTGATLALSLGYVPANGQVFTIVDNTGASAVSGTFSGLPEGATLAVDGTDFTISYVGGSGNSITLTAGLPSIALVMGVSPIGGQNPGTDLSYTITFTNAGYTVASQVVVNDAVPHNTDFKVGSATASLGSTGLSDAITYSNDGGATYTYTPTSGGGGAQSGYDRTVTNVRWTLTGSLSKSAPNNSGSVGMTARIR